MKNRREGDQQAYRHVAVGRFLVRSLITFLLAFAATTLSAAQATPPKASRDDVQLLEYEVTLRQMPASDAAGVLGRVAVAHHGMVTKLDATGGRAFVTLPASRAAGLQGDPLVTTSAPFCVIIRGVPR